MTAAYMKHGLVTGLASGLGCHAATHADKLPLVDGSHASSGLYENQYA